MKKFNLFLCFLFLTGCTAAREQFDSQSFQKLLGKNKQDVIQLLGKPDFIIKENKIEKLIYQTHYTNFEPMQSSNYLNPPFNTQNFTQSICQTTFIIKETKVINVIGQGNCL